MNILSSNPKCDGFTMPGEFEPHYGTIMIWPERHDSWQNGAYAARRAYVKIASAIAEGEKHTMLASANQYETARAMLPPEVRVIECTTDDAWARDTAPTFVKNRATGEVRGIDWGFNAWGGLYDGLYFPWDNDNHVARKVCDFLDKDCYNFRDFILEGGSIHSDGQGTIITTESCLLSGGRNPHMTKAEIEAELLDCLGAEKVIWLPRGIYNDETNEHVDNVCAFTAPGEVVLAWTDNESDPQYPLSKACLDVLSRETDAMGRKLRVRLLHIPSVPVCMSESECEGLDLMDGEPTRTPGERLAASYVNFYIANGAVLVPQFGDEMDEKALEVLRECFPDRKVIGIAARDILIGGGNIHCITQQVPR